MIKFSNIKLITKTSSEMQPLKLVTFTKVNDPKYLPSVGVVDDSLVWPLKNIDSQSSLLRVLELSGSRRPNVETETLAGLPLSEVKLLSPLLHPGNIFCVGKNYKDHVREVDSSMQGISKMEAPEYPIIFTKAAGSVVGHKADIKYPHGVSSQVDYEGELAVVIGKAGSAISREDAMSHVFGYTIVNDVTARDLQKKHQQWFLGKSMDTFCPMGPWVVPASDIDLSSGLKVQTFVNDELRQDGNTNDMLFSIIDLITIISAAVTLHPGDIIATGTPAGVGAGFKPPKFLQPGDKVVVRIEGIGELENFIRG
eukprot:CAMPEP_0196596940 /NCGR_PEP_ID=MMETSP1081-20130531/88698_1 /TAXON_ID=36882 /ORGANISM="Pyramimonas amylifera, Strain CCMP720" /LENGTH=310 /DNA_ID=CAMNT_0041922155 /DNA_START=100 /DNA_END=1032 /DNA_ORIENTATION=+